MIGWHRGAATDQWAFRHRRGTPQPSTATPFHAARGGAGAVESRHHRHGGLWEGGHRACQPLVRVRAAAAITVTTMDSSGGPGGGGITSKAGEIMQTARGPSLMAHDAVHVIDAGLTP